MKNWMQTYTSNWINLDHCTQVYVLKQDDKFIVVGQLIGVEQAFILSKDFAVEQEAFEFLNALKLNA